MELVPQAFSSTEFRMSWVKGLLYKTGDFQKRLSSSKDILGEPLQSTEWNLWPGYGPNIPSGPDLPVHVTPRKAG